MDLLIVPLIMLLLLILLVVGGVALIVSLIRALFGSRPKSAGAARSSASNPMPLRLRGSLLSSAEQHILQMLEGMIAPRHYRILAKVRLSDLVVSPPAVNPGYLAGMRVELLICRRSDWGPVCGIVWRDEAAASPTQRRPFDTGWPDWELPVVQVSLSEDITPERLASRLTGYVLFRSETVDAAGEDADSPILVESVLEESLDDTSHEHDDSPSREPDDEKEVLQGLHARNGQLLCPRCYAPMEPMSAEEHLWRCSRFPKCQATVGESGSVNP